ncbi:MAG: SigB/SigF/SigG family RNA polymerase sigma factor [Clostridia bacterium]|nr:SigB/SigF/SigG family RNA polymerase sigma factor [Clostridia bacterium]
MGLVKKIALKFLNRGIELDDAIQIGCIGLQKAIWKFDFSYEVQFSTYAVPMIMGEIKRFLRDDGTVKVSRTIKENAYKINLYIERYQNQFFREPKITEIAEALHLEKEDVVTALSYSPVCESLYAPMGDDGSAMLMDKIPARENEEEKLIEHLALHELLNRLPLREKTVIELRYFQDKTQNEVAKQLNISQVQVSRIEKKIIEGLRKKLTVS